ncbi:antibiotic biosynthesis monooxygenase [Micrococcus sp. M4NT]|uniref:putative quinol monooxygenase n=1 Tax=Micrococcus sp. M4NT TaxID=2957501 RepID=UPI0029A6A52E|nr:antibiotic biosynthesis monooxygenase [Micrococcus sp. M4NT]MDX2341446.1 antibiotic biosynthesis monooxygenase [Micrococcus sp. M4NT]
MILINVKFTAKPGQADQLLAAAAEFTAATRAEPGNLWFEWYRPVEGSPDELLLIEAFTDEGAGPHVESQHFKDGLEAQRPYLAKTPQIISKQVDGDGWGPMGELQID